MFLGGFQLKTKRIEYRWIVIAACFLMVFTTLGFCSSTKSQFIEPVSEALGIGRTAFSVVDSCRYIATAVVNAFFGVLVVRLGARKLVGVGFLSLISAMLLHTFANNIFWFYLGGVFLGIGFSFTTTTMVGYVVNKWCKKNKGKIMGAALAANGLGGALAIQIVTPIIGASENGFRTAYFIITVIISAVAILTLAFLREPREGEADSSESFGESKRQSEIFSGIELHSALRMPFFYSALAALFLAGLTLQGITGISAAHMRDVGLDHGFVASILSIGSILLAFSKFFTGFIYDKFGISVASCFCSILAVGAMLALASLSNSGLGIALVIIYSLFSALALPLETIMVPIYAMALFGERSYGKILGIFISVNTAGYALGALLMSICFDVTGSYKIAILIAAVLMSISLIVMQCTIIKAKKTRAQMEIAECVSC